MFAWIPASLLVLVAACANSDLRGPDGSTSPPGDSGDGAVDGESGPGGFDSGGSMGAGGPGGSMNMGGMGGQPGGGPSDGGEPSEAGSPPDGGEPPGDAGPAGDAGPGGGRCEGQSLLPVPDDPTKLGPWKVGVRTVSMGRLTVEITYPAEPGSTEGMQEETYDVRNWLPEGERSKVPDANSPAVTPINGSIYRDVPIDGGHGPYPVVILIHGTASFRIASGSTMTHWASRGFVVVAADYPGMYLRDQLASTLACPYSMTGPQDVQGDLDTQIQALSGATGEVAFLGDHIDMTQLGIAGHSQGACLSALSSTRDNVRIVIPMTGTSPVQSSPQLESLMYIAGMADTVIGYDTGKIGDVVCPFATPGGNKAAYNASPGPPDVTKHLVGIEGGGHLVPTDLCQTNSQGRNAVEEAQEQGVCGVNSAVVIGLPALFDCGSISMEEGIEAVNYASTAALEETLHCRDRSTQFADIQDNVPQVGEFLEETK